MNQNMLKLYGEISLNLMAIQATLITLYFVILSFLSDKKKDKILGIDVIKNILYDGQEKYIKFLTVISWNLIFILFEILFLQWNMAYISVAIFALIFVLYFYYILKRYIDLSFNSSLLNNIAWKIFEDKILKSIDLNNDRININEDFYGTNLQIFKNNLVLLFEKINEEKVSDFLNALKEDVFKRAIKEEIETFFNIYSINLKKNKELAKKLKFNKNYLFKYIRKYVDETNQERIFYNLSPLLDFEYEINESSFDELNDQYSTVYAALIKNKLIDSEVKNKIIRSLLSKFNLEVTQIKIEPENLLKVKYKLYIKLIKKMIDNGDFINLRHIFIRNLKTFDNDLSQIINITIFIYLYNVIYLEESKYVLLSKKKEYNELLKIFINDCLDKPYIYNLRDNKKLVDYYKIIENEMLYNFDWEIFNFGNIKKSVINQAIKHIFRILFIHASHYKYKKDESFTNLEYQLFNGIINPENYKPENLDSMIDFSEKISASLQEEEIIKYSKKLFQLIGDFYKKKYSELDSVKTKKMKNVSRNILEKLKNHPINKLTCNKRKFKNDKLTSTVLYDRNYFEKITKENLEEKLFYISNDIFEYLIVDTIDKNYQKIEYQNNFQNAIEEYENYIEDNDNFIIKPSNEFDFNDSSYIDNKFKRRANNKTINLNFNNVFIIIKNFQINVSNVGILVRSLNEEEIREMISKQPLRHKKYIVTTGINYSLKYNFKEYYEYIKLNNVAIDIEISYKFKISNSLDGVVFIQKKD